jgi:hypothetical protein
MFETTLDLPPAMKCCQDFFSKWYVDNNSSRVVKWNYSLGEVIIRASYFNHSKVKLVETYEIVLTPEQVFLSFFFFLIFDKAVVLNFFDNFPETSSGYTLDFLQKSIGIDLKILKRVLHSLVSQNQKVVG